jgi:O-antigen/teichoic acid export membrane protein
MSLRRNTLANYLGQSWTALMGLAFIPVYIRYLGIESWGLVGFMSMLQAWFTLLDMGLTPTLSREMARFQASSHDASSIKNLLRSMEWIYGAIALLVTFTVWLGAPFIAGHWLKTSQLSSDVLVPAIAMMGLVLAARMAEQVYRGAIQGLQAQVWMNGAMSLMATLRWVGSLGVLAWVSATVQVFFLWHGVVSLLTLFLFAHKTYRLLPPTQRPARFSVEALREVRGFAGGMATTAFLALLLTQVDKLILSGLVSLQDFGYYTLAAAVAGALSFLISPIASAIFPHLSELVAKNDQAGVIASYHRSSQWMAAILTPAALMLCGFAEPLLRLWTGDPNLAQNAAPQLAVLALGTYFNGLMNVPYMAQLAHGWTGFAVRANLIAVAIIIPAILWSVPKFGAIGAAWAWLALNAGYVFIGIHFIHKKILVNERGQWYRDAMFKPLAVGILILLLLKECLTLPDDQLLQAASLLIMTILLLTAVVLVTPYPGRFVTRRWLTGPQ